MRQKWAEQLVTGELDERRVFLDAATESTYRRVCSSDKFREVVENIEAFVRM
ncbi:MAG: hypothetical protein QGG48_00015 [Desulfatiglandales bacterium]|nr:hypothetical protein [Desulfatiglandales bacterium]